MTKSEKQISLSVYFLTFLLSGLIYAYIATHFIDITAITRLVQIYALTSIAYLYVAILATPLLALFPSFPFRNVYQQARKSLGVSACYFALLHACIAFFKELGGISGIFFLGTTYLTGTLLGGTALFILLLMTIGSLELLRRKFPFFQSPFIFKSVYLAGALLTIHALMLGTHFMDLSTTIPHIFFAALALFLILEIVWLFVSLKKSIATSFKLEWGAVGIAAVMVSAYILYMITSHQDQMMGMNMHGMSMHTHGSAGEVAIQLNQPVQVVANTPTQFTFTIQDTKTKQKITSYDIVQEKVLHLIIVDQELNFYSHQHPTLKDGTFTDSATFPHDGVYYLYLSFQPKGKGEIVKMISMNVGNQIKNVSATQLPDTHFTKNVEDCTISLSLPSELSARKLTDGELPFTFHLTDREGKPVQNLEPYLGAYGHMVMINQHTYSYLHVHPVTLTKLGNAGGPDVVFYPMGDHEAISPGIYRVFAQFNPGNHVIAVDFTIEVTK